MDEDKYNELKELAQSLRKGRKQELCIPEDEDDVAERRWREFIESIKENSKCQ